MSKSLITTARPVGSVIAGSRYSIIDLGTLGGDSSSAYSINNLGQVVGLSDTGSGDSHAFLWENGIMTDLGTLATAEPSSFEGCGSWAYSVNDLGQVVGGSYTGSGKIHAVLWDKGRIIDLGSLGGTPWAWSINNAGQVVGRVNLSDGEDYAFLWEKGTVTKLGTTELLFGIAYDINDAGQVAGWSISSDGNFEAFCWDGGTLTGLGRLASGSNDYSYANGINNAGQVVGWGSIARGRVSAFLWENSTMTDLGTLNGPFSDFSRAFDINDAGLVVGDSGFSYTHAVIWENGAIIDLNSVIPTGSGWELFTARSINNRGQIVGTGRINGETRGFLLSPISGSRSIDKSAGRQNVLTYGAFGTASPRSRQPKSTSGSAKIINFPTR